MSGHVFVDETKQPGYLLVASAVAADDLDDRRKHAIASAIVATDIQATVYDARIIARAGSHHRVLGHPRGVLKIGRGSGSMAPTGKCGGRSRLVRTDG